MRKLILALMLSIFCLGANAQTPEEAEKINKWIDTYQELNEAQDWGGMVSKAGLCKQEIPDWEYVYYYSGIAYYNLKQYDNSIMNFSIFIDKNQTEASAYLLRGHSFSENKEKIGRASCRERV